MTKHEFQATEGLLNDVMRKQAGSIEKAILEAVMNSVDAGAETINIDVNEDRILINDDGKGMTSDEVRQYFEKFGLKDDDIEEKEFGKFRMGRGQIFNFGLNIWHSLDNLMVVDLDHDRSYIHPDYLGDFDEDETEGREGEKVVLDSSGLGYNLLDASSDVQGCRVEVRLYNQLDDVDSTIENVESQIQFIPWLHDVDVYINDERLESEITPNHKTENGYFVFEPEEDVQSLGGYSSKTAVYNKGAYVNTENIVPVRSVIITRTDLDVNFARNDILDTDENWDKIAEEFMQAAEDYFIEKRDINMQQRAWLLERAVGRDQLYARIRNVPLLEDIRGERWTLTEVEDEKISYSHSGDKAAEDIMEDTGVLFLDNQHKGQLEELVEESEVLAYDDVLEDHNTFEMSVIDDEDLSKKRRERLAMSRWFLSQIGFIGEVKAGFSKHSDCWKDGDDTIYVHKGLLNRKKMEFLTEGLDELMEVAAHDGDTRQERNHDMRFRMNYWDMSRDRAEAQRELLEGKADYEYY